MTTEPNQTYEEFWKDIVETDGQLDPDKVKLELHDYRNFLNEVSEAYYGLTRGRISNPHTLASEVIRVVDELAQEDQDASLAALRQELAEAVEYGEAVSRGLERANARIAAGSSELEGVLYEQGPRFVQLGEWWVNPDAVTVVKNRPADPEDPTDLPGSYVRLTDGTFIWPNIPPSEVVALLAPTVSR